MNKYSIILPVFNGGELLKICVHSILSQTYPNFNLIVLDNCSTDGTVKFLESQNDARIIIYLSEKNLGIVGNWSRILDIPKNEFITLIGHDDILLPSYLHEIDELIKLYPNASLYQTHFNYVDALGHFMKPCKPMSYIQNYDEFIAAQMSQTMDSMGTGYMMRSVDFDSIGGMPSNYPNLIFADYELWVKLTKLSNKVTSAKFCFNYRIHNSVSKTTNGEEYAAAFHKYILFLNTLRQDSKIKNVFENYGYQFLMYFCQSLSHRILKTPLNKRKIKVGEFIEQCKIMAAMIIPGKAFNPLKYFKIRIAKQLDNHKIFYELFRIFKRV